jgi:hypothetical protein
MQDDLTPVQPVIAPVRGHEAMGTEADRGGVVVDEATLKRFRMFVRLGVSSAAKLKKLVERGDKLFKGDGNKSEQYQAELGQNGQEVGAPTRVNKLRKKIVSAVTQIYARNPKFIGIPRRPIMVPADPVVDQLTGQPMPAIDPMTGLPAEIDISEQVADVTASIMDHIFMETQFKAEAKACTLEAHHRPGSVMQVGYEYDPDNKVDDIYFRWRSFKRIIIDPRAEIYNGTLRKCRFVGVRWSMSKAEAEGMGLDWTAMRDRDSQGDVKESKEDDDDEIREVFQVWSQDTGTMGWISENAPRFAKAPEPWPWEIDGYPFAILKFTEDTDAQFSKPLIVEAEGIQREMNEQRETMERYIVCNRKVVLYDSEMIDDAAVSALCGRRKDGWKGIEGLSSRASPPVQVFNDEKLEQGFFDHYDRNEAEMDAVLGTSANENLAFTGKTAREVDEVSKNAGTMQSGKSDIQADFLNEIVRKAVQIMRQTYTEERVNQITTRDGARFWVKWKGSEILSEVDLRVEVGSTMTEDDETKKQVALNLFDKLQMVAGISVRRLTNDLLREFGKKNVEQYWDQGMGAVPGQVPGQLPPPQAPGGPQPEAMDPAASIAGQMSPAVQAG